MNFDQAFTRLLRNEGAFSNNPSDPGGATMWGITQRVAEANGYTGAMRDLTQEQAKSIYRKRYWDAIQADKLPDAARFDVFDGAVNSGVAQSAKWLQRAVGMPDDGVIGPGTIAACNNLPGYIIAARYNGQRLDFMTRLAAWEVFGRGWARRIAGNLQGV